MSEKYVSQAEEFLWDVCRKTGFRLEIKEKSTPEWATCEMTIIANRVFKSFQEHCNPRSINLPLEAREECAKRMLLMVLELGIKTEPIVIPT